MLWKLPGVQRRQHLALLGSAFVLTASARAAADPQASALVIAGAGAVSLGGGSVAAFHLGARGDLLFLRDRDRAMGVGPFVSVESEAFRSLSVEAGIDWLVPAPSVTFPFTFAAGGYDRRDDAGARQGVLGEILWGSHGYNFDGHYDLAFGLFAEVRYALGSGREEDVIGGVAIDLSLLGYPFLLAYEAIAR
jgi:hypothetical protein